MVIPRRKPALVVVLVRAGDGGVAILAEVEQGEQDLGGEVDHLVFPPAQVFRIVLVAVVQLVIGGIRVYTLGVFLQHILEVVVLGLRHLREHRGVSKGERFLNPGQHIFHGLPVARR